MHTAGNDLDSRPTSNMCVSLYFSNILMALNAQWLSHWLLTHGLVYWDWILVLIPKTRFKSQQGGFFFFFFFFFFFNNLFPVPFFYNKNNPC